MIRRAAVNFLLVVLLISMHLASAEGAYGWVMCQPDSWVNIRARPSGRAEIVAQGYMCDRVMLDGKKRSAWVHVIVPCEAGEGWINEGFLSEDEPEDVGSGHFVITDNRVNARSSAGGNIRKKLNKGYELEVFMITAVWSVTSQGFIQTRYLCEVCNRNE